MADPSIFFVGTQAEVGHHATPLQALREVRIAPPEEIAQTARPGDLAVFTMEHFDRFRNACLELKTQNVATLYLIDGILEWRNAWENREDEPACPWTMRPVLAHKVACIGHSQARVLTDWGNGAKVEVVGVPRFDGLRRIANPAPGGVFKLLVMTAKCPGFTGKQIENAARALGDLKNWLDKNPHTADGRPLEVIWRLTQGMDAQIGVQNQLNDFTGADLADTLKRVDAVITTPSTAMLEAMLFELPVALLDFNNSPQYVSAAWQINSRGAMCETLPQLMAPSAAKMLFQQSVLNDALICDDHATRRLAALIDRMLEIAAEKITAGQPLEFSEPILTGADFGESTHSARIVHSAVYSNFAEFQEDRIPELQSQLAHSRREIKHLQREMAQLQLELDEAHRIFDQINQHPIAGPIVRARQKLIDWIARFKKRKIINAARSEPQRVPTDIEPTSGEPVKQG